MRGSCCEKSSARTCESAAAAVAAVVVVVVNASFERSNASPLAAWLAVAVLALSLALITRVHGVRRCGSSHRLRLF